MLAGGLTDEDDAAILEELAQLTGVEEPTAQLDNLPDVPTDQLPEIGNEVLPLLKFFLYIKHWMIFCQSNPPCHCHVAV